MLIVTVIIRNIMLQLTYLSYFFLQLFQLSTCIIYIHAGDAKLLHMYVIVSVPARL